MDITLEDFYLMSPDEQIRYITASQKNRGRKRSVAAYVRHYRQRLETAAASCFRWEGIGEHAESRFIEHTLLFKNQGIFYVQEPDEVPDIRGYDGDTITEPRLTFREAVPGGYLTDQWITSEYRTIQPNGTGRLLRTAGEVERWDGIPVYDNQQHNQQIMQAIKFHANRLAQAALTVDINLENSRTQKIALVEQEQVKTAQMLDDNINQGNGTIIAKRGKTLDFASAFQILDFSVAPDLAEVNHGVFHRLMGEAYTAIGVKAQPNEKSAQQTEVEIEAPDSFVQSIRLSRYDARRWAVDKANKRYGLSMRCIDTGTGES